MTYAAGTMVRARGRDWVVQPDSTEALVRVKPLGAPDIEATAILAALEAIVPAQFPLPDPVHIGDTRSARMLRDAVRLGFRASAGPFRCLGGVAVEPRPYQMVPLLMALRQDPVRLLIADDVGIGKTVEAALIAKELIARGECERLCVLCPPHLADQWRSELESKFNMEPVLVLPSTVAKLEQRLPPGMSVFERFPVTIVSLDYIKSERRRHDFLRTCPELVIVDEVHTCTQAIRGAGQQRFRLLQELSRQDRRHLILVTATPHSGNDQAFRSMLSLLRKEFESLPDDLGGDQNRGRRERLAAHFVQRRRGDILHYLKEETPFPAREEAERTYKLHPDYRRFLDAALRYAREVIQDQSGTKFQQRIRWWSALALLRSISSSPAAAAATLRARARNADSQEADEIEELGRQSVMDTADADAAEALDVAPGADVEAMQPPPVGSRQWAVGSGEAGAPVGFPPLPTANSPLPIPPTPHCPLPTPYSTETPNRRRLLEMARQAEALQGDRDHKLAALTEVVKKLIEDGFRPIVFCKYIPTAGYIAEHLRKRLKSTEVACITGELPHDEREERVLALAAHERRVLVCTDCLSEGINLQEQFDAAVHADLAWSPTRHEQREGRVDRFNQASPTVRVVTLYGEDNPIDGIVLNILVRKHRAIRTSLGVSVPVPMDSDKVLEAIFEALLLKGSQDASQLSLFDTADLPERKQLNIEWDRAADREKRSRTLFAQHAIRPGEVEPELAEVRAALGSPLDLERFVREAVRASGGVIDAKSPFTMDLGLAPLPLRDAVHYAKPMRATFTLPPPRGATTLTRTHPFVEALAGYLADSALAGDPGAVAKRCGVTATDAVRELTTILLLRFRFQIVAAKAEMLAEDAAIVAFTGTPAHPQWLPESEAEALLTAPPRGNVAGDLARDYVQDVIDEYDSLRAPVQEIAKARAATLLASHRRVRKAVEGSHAARDIRVQGEPDVLGIYVLLPYEQHGGSRQ